MKKLLLGSIILTAFSLSLALFQISCKKDAQAQTTSFSQENKILFFKKSNLSTEIWSANYDGTNQQKLNIAVPLNMNISGEANLAISPDRKTIFFVMIDKTNEDNHLYSANIDGSNVKKIISASTTSFVFLGEAY